jgi:riboflavin kinase/FMN adenylyltransferase
MSATEFLQDILLDRLKAKEIIVGENFFFGRDREGSVSFLNKTAPEKGFRVFSCAPVKRDGISISSSSIRDHLSAGRIEKANRMLGRSYSITGKVVPGASQGRKLGFPTANIRTDNEIVPPGVHITCVHLGDKKLASITNVGDCPTLPGDKSGSIESYIMDFDGDLYGHEIHLFFLKKLRDEIRFPSVQKLRFQIQQDLKAARHYFSEHDPNNPC